jgi:hypothetical protein
MLHTSFGKDQEKKRFHKKKEKETTKEMCTMIKDKKNGLTQYGQKKRHKLKKIVGRFSCYMWFTSSWCGIKLKK